MPSWRRYANVVLVRLLIAALLIVASIPALAANATVAAAPDFAWGARSSAKVQSLLTDAQAKWNAAASLPTSPDCLRSAKCKCLDETYLRELVRRTDQGQVAYALLDAAMGRLAALDSCRKLYTEAIRLAGSSAPGSAQRFDDSYYLLHSRIKLAIGLSRAAISRQVTDPDSCSYCFQAMESAIDALRDAADDAQKVTDGAKRADSIRKLRSVLFSAWEEAQRTKDTNPIGAIDIRSAFDESGLLPPLR